MKIYNTIEEIRADREVVREKINSDVTDEDMAQIIVDAMEHYTGGIMAVINPMEKLDIPFVIAALRQILEVFEGSCKEALPAAKVIGILTSSEYETITIKPNGEEAE